MAMNKPFKQANEADAIHPTYTQADGKDACMQKEAKHVNRTIAFL
jgi:hypothetical protein